MSVADDGQKRWMHCRGQVASIQKPHYFTRFLFTPSEAAPNQRFIDFCKNMHVIE